jgi:hypothetical protein
MGGGAETHGHLLNYDRHAKRESNERKEESDAKLCTRSGIGEHAGPVVLSEHDQNARPDQQPQQLRPRGKATPGACGRHPDAIMRTIYVFVGNDDGFVAVGIPEELGFWKLLTYAHCRIELT